MYDGTLYQHLIQAPQFETKFSDGWTPLSVSSIKRVPEAWKHWLRHRGSLTSKLLEFSDGEFRVRLLTEHWQRPSRYEALKLGLDPALTVRVREVELLCQEQVVVFARTIVPLSLHRREQSLFMGMGTRPLGHFLFREGTIDIARRDIKICHSTNSEKIFARATPFQFRGSEILVSEFFVNPLLVSSRN